MFTRSRLTALTLLGLLLLAAPAMAQEAAAQEGPSGIPLLFLLIGLGAVVIVGGVMIARERFTGDAE